MSLIVQFLWLLLMSNFTSVPQGITAGEVVSFSTQAEHHKSTVTVLTDSPSNALFFALFEELELEEDDTHSGSITFLSLNNFLNYLPFFYELPANESNGYFLNFILTKLPLFLKYRAFLI